MEKKIYKNPVSRVIKVQGKVSLCVGSGNPQEDKKHGYGWGDKNHEHTGPKWHNLDDTNDEE